MSSVEELRKKLAEKDKAARLNRAEQAKDDAVKEKQADMLRKTQELSEAERERCQTVFDKYFNASGSGKVTAETLVDVSKTLPRMRPITIEEATEAISVLDFDNDGSLNFDEFAQWWIAAITASPPMSMLRSIVKAQEAHLKLEKVIATELATTPATKWLPQADFSGEVTVGDVTDDFSPDAGIYFTALPSTTDNVEEAIRGATKEIRDAADENEDDDEEELVDRNWQALAVIRLSIAEDADEEDIETAVEMLKAVVGEYNSQDETPVDVKPVLDRSRNQLKLYIFVRGPTEENDELIGDPIQAQLETMGIDGNMTFFEKVLVGVEFDDASAFDIRSGKPLISLINTARGFASATISEAAVLVIDSLIWETMRERRIGHRRQKSKFFTLLLPRLVRSIAVSQSFRTPRELLRAAVEQIVTWPERVSATMNKRDGSTFTTEQIGQIQEETANFRSIIEAILAREFPFDIAARDLLGNRQLDETFGELPPRAVTAVVGDESLAQKFIAAVTEDEQAAASGVAEYRLKDRIPFTFRYVPEAKVRTVAGMGAISVVATIDGKSSDFVPAQVEALVEAAKQAQSSIEENDFELSEVLVYVYVANPYDQEEIETRINDGLEAAELQAITTFEDEHKSQYEEFLEENWEAMDDLIEDSDVDEPENQILQSLAVSLRKVVKSVASVDVTTRVVDARLDLDTIPIDQLLPTSVQDLNDLRSQGRVQLRAARKSVKSESLDKVSLKAIQAVMKEVLYENEKAIAKAEGESEPERDDDDEYDSGSASSADSEIKPRRSSLVRMHRDPSDMVSGSASSSSYDSDMSSDYSD